MTDPTPAPDPNARRTWYMIGAGALALLILLLIEGLAQGVWHALGGLIRLVWTIGRVLWHLIVPG